MLQTYCCNHNRASVVVSLSKNTIVLPLSALTLPLVIYFLATFYRQIPDGLEDAARVEGSTRIGVLFKVIMPLSTLGVAMISGYVSLSGIHWLKPMLVMHCIQHGCTRVHHCFDWVCSEITRCRSAGSRGRSSRLASWLPLLWVSRSRSLNARGVCGSFSQTGSPCREECMVDRRQHNS
jgi:hypothetical protein